MCLRLGSLHYEISSFFWHPEISKWVYTKVKLQNIKEVLDNTIPRSIHDFTTEQTDFMSHMSPYTCDD